VNFEEVQEKTLYKWAYQLIHLAPQWMNVDDLVQEGRIALWQGRYARHGMIDSFKRKNKWEYFTPQDFLPLFSIHDPQYSPLLEELLLKLSAKQRHVFILKLKGLKNKEIADMLDVTEGAISIRLKKIYGLLKDIYHIL